MSDEPMSAPPPRIALNWSAVGVLFAMAVSVAGVVGWLAPLRSLPEDMKAMQSRAEANTLETKVSLSRLDLTMTNLNKTVGDLSDSIKDVRALRSEFNTFRDQTQGELARLKRQE